MGVKKCLCGCGRDRYSHGYSQYCQRLRSDDKWKRTIEKQRQPKQYTSIKRTPIKTKFKEATGEGVFFENLWDNLDPDKRVSFVSGEHLGRYAEYVDEEGYYKKTSDFYSMFHHILKKEIYGLFRFYKENIILLTPNPKEHSQVHEIAWSELIKLNVRWGLVKEKHDILLRRYNCKHVFIDGVCECGMEERNYLELKLKAKS